MCYKAQSNCVAKVTAISMPGHFSERNPFAVLPAVVLSILKSFPGIFYYKYAIFRKIKTPV